MAISGRLEADFAAFYTACEQAVVNLRDIESGGGKVQSALDRVGDAFSGRKIITDATLIAKVFDDAGGAASFTEKELARMSATGSEAVAKLKAMGQDVPPGIQRIADETRNAAKEQGGLGETVKSVALSFAAMFSLRAAKDFVSGILEQSSALVDLSQQTHIGIEDIQTLGSAMSEFGVDQETLAKGLFTLSRKVAGGDDSVAHALAVMGMSLKDVQGLQGQELFLKMEQGLATLQGSLRDTTASDLFGSKMGMAMAGASEGIEDTLAKTKALGVEISGPAAMAMDQYGESIARSQKSLTAVAANMIGPVAEGFNTLFDLTTKGAGNWAILNAVLDDTSAMITGRGTGTENLTRLLDQQTVSVTAATAGAKQEAAGHQEVTVALTEQAQAERFIATLQANAATALNSAQLANLAHLKDIGQLNAANALGIGVNTAQFASYTAQVTKSAEVERQRAADQKTADALEAKTREEITRLWADYDDQRVAHGGTANEIAIAQIDHWAADLTAKMVKAGADTAGFYKALAADSAEKSRAVGIDWAYINSHSQEALEEMARNARATYNEMASGSKTFSRDALDEQLAKTERAEDAARGLGDQWVASMNAASASAAGLNAQLAEQEKRTAEIAEANRMAGGQGAQWIDQDVANQLTDSEKRKLADEFNTTQRRTSMLQIIPAVDINVWTAAAQRIIDKRLALEARVEAAEQKHLAAVAAAAALVPKFAGGVTNFSGGLAVVGERGPELVNLPAGSSVMPSGQFGGGVVVQNTFHIVDTESNLAQRVSASILRSLLVGQKMARA